MTKAMLCSILSLALLSSHANADNWGHWRGPTGNSVAASGSPPTQWSSTKNVKWKVEIPGKGSGSPVVWGNQVFVVTAVPADGGGNRGQTRGQAGAQRGQGGDRPQGRPQNGQRRGPGGGGSAALTKLQFKLLCFNRENGELVWQQTATEATPHQATHSTNGFSSASPCTDGQHVYAHFGSRGLYCYTMDGELTWKRDDFGKMNTRSDFGEGSSPTIAGDMIIVPWDHEGPSYLYALNKLTGDTIWKTKRDEPSCWATPLVIEHAGRKQIVMNGQTCARGYDLETGKELWRCAGQTDRPVASAVAGDGLVFVGSGFRGSFLGAFRPDGAGDIEGSSSVAWTLDRDTPDIASPLLSARTNLFPQGQEWAPLLRRCRDWQATLYGQQNRWDQQHLCLTDRSWRIRLSDRSQWHNRRNRRCRRTEDRCHQLGGRNGRCHTSTRGQRTIHPWRKASVLYLPAVNPAQRFNQRCLGSRESVWRMSLTEGHSASDGGLRYNLAIRIL